MSAVTRSAAVRIKRGWGFHNAMANPQIKQTAIKGWISGRRWLKLIIE
jgi:hypothetical protein